MKNFLKLIVVTLMLSLTSSVSLSQSPEDVAVIKKFIASQESDANGSEYPEAEKIVVGDLNHDGVPDAVVLYTLEGQNGGNNYIQYLAAFVRKNGSLVHVADTPVGGKLRRDVDLSAISNNEVVLKTTAYAKRDPACCPTIKGSTKYVLVGNKLQEVKAARPRGSSPTVREGSWFSSGNEEPSLALGLLPRDSETLH